MRRYQLFVLFVLILTPSLSQLFAQSQEDQDCKEFLIKIETKDTVNGSDGEIILTILGNKGTYTIDIFGEGHYKNRLKATTHEKDLQKGEYIIVVQDKSGCSKMVKAIIK
jgi:hypothetical protein